MGQISDQLTFVIGIFWHQQLVFEQMLEISTLCLIVELQDLNILNETM